MLFDLLAPGHPLLDAVVSLAIERHGTQLKQGAVLVNRRDETEEPHVLVAIFQEVADGHDRVIGKRFDFVEIGRQAARAAGAAPYLDYAPTTEEERRLVAGVPQGGLAGERRRPARRRLGRRTRTGVVRGGDPCHGRRADRARPQTRPAAPAPGDQLMGHQTRRPPRRRADRQNPQDPVRRPRHDGPASWRPVSSAAWPTWTGENRSRYGAPSGGRRRTRHPQGLRDGPPETYARDTAGVERRAVDRVLEEERKLGRIPEGMSHNNPGYDIRSKTVDDHWIFIEVKGRVNGADDFHVTRTEVLTGKNAGPNYRLALVSVHPDGPQQDEVRYIVNPFRDLDFGDFAATDLGGDWHKEWARGGAPV